MKKALIVTWVFMVIGIVFTASSCSVPVNFYLRNMTVSPVKVEVYLTDIDGTLKDYPVLFSKGIEPLTFSSYKKMSAVNGKIIEGANAYELLLPAQSTFFVGRGSNFHNGFFDKIIITDEDGISVILDENNTEILLRDKTPPNRFYAWYDVR